MSRIHPDDREPLRRLREQSLASGTAFSTEIRIIDPGNVVRWCVTAGAPTLDRNGRAVRISGVTLDITERKQVEAALTQANVDLEQRVAERTREREAAQSQLHEMQKMESLGQLTGGIAHDFNNLLMIVLGNLHLLRKRLPEDPRMSRMLDGAIQGAERGASLTKRMLAFARRQQLRPEAVDVAKLIDSIFDMLSRSIGATIVIDTNFQAGLPPTFVDPNQLELALLNLILNSRDAMPEGGRVTIAVQHETDKARRPQDLADGDYISVTVTDSGTGMDESTLKRATEPFFTSKGVGKGTGLGLSMVHGLAAQSGGTLRITSEFGMGTTVEMWLPVATGYAETEHPVTLPDPIKKSQPCRVLLVDDDFLVLSGTAAMLEDLGHRVIEASSGARALDTLHAGTKVDLIITDFAMPEMTGVQLARKIRQSWPQLPIIMATGYAELPDDEAPNYRLLNKPFLQHDLAEQITGVLNQNANA